MGCGKGGGGDPVVEAAEVAVSSPETDSSFLNPVTLSRSSRCPQNPSHPKPKPPSQPQVSSSNAHCMHHPQSLRKTLTPKPTLAAASSTLQPFHPSTFQTFNPSTLQSFNPSPFHPFNPSTIQPFKHSTLQPFNPSTLQPYRLSILLPSPSTLQPFNLHPFTLSSSIPAQNLDHSKAPCSPPSTLTSSPRSDRLRTLQQLIVDSGSHPRRGNTGTLSGPTPALVPNATHILNRLNPSAPLSKFTLRYYHLTTQTHNSVSRTRESGILLWFFIRNRFVVRGIVQSSCSKVRKAVLSNLATFPVKYVDAGWRNKLQRLVCRLKSCFAKRKRKWHGGNHSGMI